MADKARETKCCVDTTWRAKGTAFQAKGTASRKVLRPEGAKYRSILGLKRSEPGVAAVREAGSDWAQEGGRGRPDEGSLVGPSCGVQTGDSEG